MAPRKRTLLLALAVTPLWLNPLAWWLAFSPVPVVSHAGTWLVQFEFVFLLGLLPAFGLLVVCSIGLFSRHYRSGALAWLACAVVFAGAYFGGIAWRTDICRTNLHRMTERAQPLVDAITAYHAEHGRAPAALTDLVPQYLDRVPETGVGAYPDFDYWPGRAQQFRGNEWVLIASPPFVLFGAGSFYYYPRQNYAESGFRPVGNWGYHGD